MNERETSLIFTGDIGFDRYMAGRWKDPDLLDGEILSFFRSGDHVVANVEGALMRADGAGSGRGVYFHAMDPEAVSFLKLIRADLWHIANNHIMDAGAEGLRNTMDIARACGARTLGAGPDLESASAPVILPEAGGIGLLSVGYQPECPAAGAGTPGNFSWNEFGLIRRRIDEIRRTCRWCVLISHGGEEFAGLPMPTIRSRYLRYLEMGADLVVAHHPHVPQHYELTPDGKAIFYSLGNFIFDTDYQRAQYHTDEGVLLKLTFTPEGFRHEALGLRLLRGEERLAAAPLPVIFANVEEKEYAALTSLSARAMVAAEKRRMIYLDPDRYRNADDETWNAYFDSDEVEDLIRGEYMDFRLIRNLIREENPGEAEVPAFLKDYLTDLIGS